jgi:hypothetical protein
MVRSRKEAAGSWMRQNRMERYAGKSRDNTPREFVIYQINRCSFKIRFVSFAITFIALSFHLLKFSKMLNIVIVKGHPDGSLEFNVNGAPGGPENGAKRGWRVHWRVDPSPKCNVLYIHDIKMKTGSGAPPSIDIFSGNPPSPQDRPHRKHWMGTVDSSACVGAEYNYDIEWMPKDGGEKETFDPKISVMPSLHPYLKHISWIVLSLIGIFSVRHLLKKKKSKHFFNKFR